MIQMELTTDFTDGHGSEGGFSGGWFFLPTIRVDLCYLWSNCMRLRQRLPGG